MRILVIEDERRIARNIKEGLEQERYAVDLAYDGLEGYDLAAGEEYEVIILDLMLPKMDGMTLCRKLREEKITTPILILTAKGQTKDKIEGLNAGADDYLTKPFSFEELLARLRVLTRRPKNSLGEVLAVGDLRLDSKNYQVKKGGREINLTAKEFALLEYLMRNVGLILSKEQIIAHVWNYEADILLNTVEVYIRNLRKKLRDTGKGEKALIKTRRGFGYQLSGKNV